MLRGNPSNNVSCREATVKSVPLFAEKIYITEITLPSGSQAAIETCVDDFVAMAKESVGLNVSEEKNFRLDAYALGCYFGKCYANDPVHAQQNIMGVTKLRLAGGDQSSGELPRSNVRRAAYSAALLIRAYQDRAIATAAPEHQGNQSWITENNINYFLSRLKNRFDALAKQRAIEESERVTLGWSR